MFPGPFYRNPSKHLLVLFRLFFDPPWGPAGGRFFPPSSLPGRRPEIQPVGPPAARRNGSRGAKKSPRLTPTLFPDPLAEPALLSPALPARKGGDLSPPAPSAAQACRSAKAPAFPPEISRPALAGGRSEDSWAVAESDRRAALAAGLWQKHGAGIGPLGRGAPAPRPQAWGMGEQNHPGRPRPGFCLLYISLLQETFPVQSAPEAEIVPPGIPETSTVLPICQNPVLPEWRRSGPWTSGFPAAGRLWEHGGGVIRELVAPTPAPAVRGKMDRSPEARCPRPELSRARGKYVAAGGEGT